MANTLSNYRFMERDYDYTFRFSPNGAVTIIDNVTNTTIKPSQLTGAPLRFYALKNIQWIKSKLQESNSPAAG